MTRIRCYTTEEKLLEKGLDFAFRKGGTETLTSYLSNLCQLEYWDLCQGASGWYIDITMADEAPPKELTDLVEQYGTWELMPDALG